MFFIALITVSIFTWTGLGVFWAMAYNMGKKDIKNCKLLTVIIGGPFWWLIYNPYKKQISKLFEPRKVEK